MLEPLMPSEGEPPSCVVMDDTKPVVRREFGAMSKEDRDRFFRAMSQMVKPASPDDPAYFSPFFQIASYNRWPMNFGTNIPKRMMPLWYRAYLHEFEAALQAADVACGGDGGVALPYINVFANPAVPEQVQQFAFPEEYQRANEELAKVSARLSSDSFALAVQSALVGVKVRKGMCDEELDAAAARVLTAYGFKDAEFAAFNPMFYMVVCSVDRMYALYGGARMRGVTPKSPEYWKILVPFRKLPMELIETKQLGYVYEK